MLLNMSGMNPVVLFKHNDFLNPVVLVIELTVNYDD